MKALPSAYSSWKRELFKVYFLFIHVLVLARQIMDLLVTCIYIVDG